MLTAIYSIVIITVLYFICRWLHNRGKKIEPIDTAMMHKYSDDSEDYYTSDIELITRKKENV